MTLRYIEIMRILLIDDEERIIELLAESLTDDGHELQGFSDPTKALETFFSSPNDFDVVVTDHLMPSMLGVDIIHCIKEHDPLFPIVLATGNYTEDLNLGPGKERYENLAILQKPYRKDALIEKMNSFFKTD